MKKVKKNYVGAWKTLKMQKKKKNKDSSFALYLKQNKTCTHGCI